MTQVAPQGSYPPPPPPAGAAYPPAGQPPPPPGYQPPPPGYQPHPGATATNTTVVVAHPGFGGMAQPGGTCHYGQVPCLIQCQFCGATVTTSTSYSVGTFAWLIGLVILLLGFWVGCCLIPCCIDGCKDVIHTCPNCGATVGRFKRL